MGYRKLWITGLILGLMVSFCSFNTLNNIQDEICAKGLIKPIGKVGTPCDKEE